MKVIHMKVTHMKVNPMNAYASLHPAVRRLHAHNARLRDKEVLRTIVFVTLSVIVLSAFVLV